MADMTVGELLEQLQRAQGLGTTNNKNRMLMRWSYNAIMALAERVSVLEIEQESRSPDGDGLAVPPVSDARVDGAGLPHAAHTAGSEPADSLHTDECTCDKCVGVPGFDALVNFKAPKVTVRGLTDDGD